MLLVEKLLFLMSNFFFFDFFGVVWLRFVFLGLVFFFLFIGELNFFVIEL